MPEGVEQTLEGVTETLLVTLYIRAMESQRPDALIKDEQAVALMARIGYDFGRIKLLHLSEANKLVIVLRSRECDRYARDFLARHPQATVVHMGCGLDSRFERVDDGKVEWYDLDRPDVIALRRKLIDAEGPRYHLLGCSVLDEAWLEAVSTQRGRAFLFLAEGLFMYLHGAQVKALVQMLRGHFPGAKLVFDCYSPLHLWVSNLQTARFGLRCHWGVRHGEELEGWAQGVRLLDEWGYMDSPDARVASLRWLRPFETLARTIRIYHFQLGEAAAPGGRDVAVEQEVAGAAL